MQRPRRRPRATRPSYVQLLRPLRATRRRCRRARCSGSIAARRRLVRRVPGQDERHALALRDRELGRPCVRSSPSRLDRRAEAQRVRAGDRPTSAAVDAADPRDDRAVVEADDELHPHRRRDRARPSTIRTRSGARLARRHEVDERGPRRRRSRTRSRGRACRRDSGGASRGTRRPARSASGRSRACRAARRSSAPESNRGRQSQSIEPSRPTSAAVWQSPISA